MKLQSMIARAVFATMVLVATPASAQLTITNNT